MKIGIIRIAVFFVYLEQVKYFRLNIVLWLCMAAHCLRAQQASFSFDTLFVHHHEAFDSVIAHREDYRLQILYTRIDRDQNNIPHLTTYSYDADKYYYYCASMVKLPACALTLEKINNLAAYRIDMLDSLGIDSIGCTELNPRSLMLGSPYSCLGHYIKEMLMLSNNHAFNPVYDFLGQRYFQDRLHEIGISSAVISNRFAGCDTTQNRLCDPISLFDRHTHQLKYYQPCTNNDQRQFYSGNLDPQVGIGYLGGSNQLINLPKDFRFANYIALSDLHKLLTKIILPETQLPDERLNLTRRDYQYLYKCMGIFPRESAYPKLDSIHYPDNFMKYFIGLDSGTYVMPDNIRIFNKVGQAYGFMTDCSYVVDTLSKVEFFLSCSMYLNKDGILNDGVYEYDQIGYPFFHNLFNTIYAEELGRPRKYLPRLQLPDFSDTLLVKPGPPIWMKVDTNSPMEEMEAVLCRLADSMWSDSRLYINYDKLKSDEIFYRNLSLVLRQRKSLTYPFTALQQKSISILTSDDGHFRVVSWDQGSSLSGNTVFLFADTSGNIYLRKVTDFKDNKALPKLIYSNIYEVKGSKPREFEIADSLGKEYMVIHPYGNIYLLLGKTDDNSSEYLQAYYLNPWDKDKPCKAFAFEYNGNKYADISVEKRTGKEHITYDPKHKIIKFPMIIKSGKKFKTQQVKLKFDGYVFRH
jgi:hypothetical protein